MMCGQEPGSARSEITWTKIPSTTLARMKDDSLIHLFTRKKTIKRRTKLLNRHLEERLHHTISYPGYIKVKTAVLRTLSDDEETNDDSILSDEQDYNKPHVQSEDSRTSALRALLKDMMLDSQSSSEEFQVKIPKQEKLRRKIKQKNPKLNSSNSNNNNKTNVIVKRPRGRPRKYPLTPNDSSTKSINTFFKSNDGKNEAKNIKLSQQKLEFKSIVKVNNLIGDDNHDDLTSDIVTIIVDNNENSNASNISNLRDPLSHDLTPIKITPGKISANSHDQDSYVYEKISKMIANGVDPQIAAVASKICSTDDDSSNQESLNKNEFPRENENVSEGNLIHDDDDDMFEEEKIITQEELIINNEHDDMFEEKTNIVDSEEEPIIFTQEFDGNTHDKVENIEDYVEQVVKQFDEKFSDNLKEKSNESPKKLVITQEKLNEYEGDHEVVNELEKSSEKTKINSEVKGIMIQSSPKTPADVKRNLMASLNSLIEKSIINDQISSLDGEDSRPDDLCSLPPPDSGIDEDSETILPQESPKCIKNDLKKISPLKKLPNLKITCTEVVKSKYMIIKNGKDDKSPVKSLPQAIEDANSLTKSFNDENNDLRLQYSNDGDDNYYNNTLSFREQLNNYDSDYDDDDYEEKERNKLRRNPISLTIPSESESLKYVLNSLSGREHYFRNPNEDESDILQRELLVEEISQSENEEGSEILPRPTSIPEFIEASDFVPLDVHPSFTLADIGEDEDIYLMEIPRTILEKDLKGKIVKLMEGKMIIGNEKYDVQEKEGRAMSCVLHCGDDRHIYKTGIIEPIGDIVVTRKVRDEMKTPEVEFKSFIAVPFPEKIKSRNSFVQMESTQVEMDKYGEEEEEEETKKRKLSESDRMDGYELINEESRRNKKNKKCRKRDNSVEKQDIREDLFKHKDIEENVNQEFEDELADEKCEIVKKKMKKKSKKCRKLFHQEESLIDIQNNSVLCMKKDEYERDSIINEEFTVKKKKKRSKRDKKLKSEEEESSIIPKNMETMEIMRNEEVSLSNNEELHVSKKMKKSKKRKRLRGEREAIDNSDVNESEVESNFKAKKRKESSFKCKYEQEDEIKIPKKSFYDQIMEDSD